MPDIQASFPHLPLPSKIAGLARTLPKRTAPNQTDLNKSNRVQHSEALEKAALSVVNDLSSRKSSRMAPPTALLPPGTPLLLEIDQDTELDFLRAAFGFELLSEEENGFVIVTSKDVNLGDFVAKIRAFGLGENRSGQTARVYQLFPDETRWQHILSPDLLNIWATLGDETEYIVDISVGCAGDVKFPDPVEREPDEPEERFARRTRTYAEKRAKYYNLWGQLQIERENQLESLVVSYGGQIIQQTQDNPGDGSLADSFTARVRIKGLGLRDVALNFPTIFDITLPDEFGPLPLVDGNPGPPSSSATLLPPNLNAPAVCVIDSGIQEQHRLLTSAMDSASSRCFLPGCSPTDVADYVRGGGHGTRVAGAVLFGENIPTSGSHQLEVWIQNARVLNEQNKMPVELMPAHYIREVVAHFMATQHQTRLYNHSINSSAPHRQRHMSVWAAGMDALAFRFDVLFIQSAGNVADYCDLPSTPGIRNHMAAGRNYPDYLLMESSRVSNPAQSLQAITVGSIAYKDDFVLGRGIFACKDGPSSFSKTGLGLWRGVKPDVVEYGGDWMHDSDDPMSFSKHEEHSPDLVRSTLLEPGPDKARDALGTSFAAAKVSHLAAKLQSLLPDEPTLLYRALIAQSAKWPQWAEASDEKESIVRHIGYGLPSEERATSNSPYRITLVTSGTQSVQAGEAHLYDISIPSVLREVGEEYDIRIEVTLSYAARPRRTRRSHRYYLSTWLSWEASGKNETPASFRRQVFKGEEPGQPEKEDTIKWHIGKRADAGNVRGTSRNFSTLQKDWAIVRPYELGEKFSLAIVGHRGWDQDPDAFANYALAVSFEVPGKEITIYDEIRASVQQLVQSTVQAEVAVAAE